MNQAWLPDYIYTDGRFQSGRALVCDQSGRIVEISDRVEGAVRLPGRAMLPGMVNAHSHAFQRVIRGRTEYRSQNTSDSFWTWREQMYAAATTLTPEQIYSASRLAFLEMAMSGITAVGEFHYIHHSPDGTPYSDPNLLAHEVIRAARDVGIRIALLRVAYARAGYQVEPNPRQIRFIESEETYLTNLDQLLSTIDTSDTSDGMAWAGIAPHSVRAVPLDYLKRIVAFANERGLPVHMHVAEQPAEVTACIQEYGRSPVALLDTEGLLSDRFTAVHAVHVTPKAVDALARSGAGVCACPTTERNLGDGVVPADLYFKSAVAVSLGTDSQIQIDLLEDARELEYHLRLQKMERNVLAAGDGTVATRLFDCATVNGAKAIGFDGGKLEPGRPADFFTVDLNDVSIAGWSLDNLLANIVFSLSRTAIRDVVVGGKELDLK
ncbi:MAG TPA: formimidoylglutamate deiminase [Pyrinomonadaceae bacterium]|nr:formimidoylglutamate deiminase [Pyrinomonadaceae bacterium]